MDSYVLHRAHRLFGTPEFVKQAQAVEPEDLVNLPDEAFADPTHRRYPVHTKAACWLSNAEFWASATFDPHSNATVGDALLKRASFWGIKSEVGQILTKVAADHARFGADLPDDLFALVVDFDGQHRRYFPMADAATVKTSAQNLYATRHSFPYELRKTAADRIRERAQTYGVQLEGDSGDYICKLAGQAKTSNEGMMSALRLRGTLCGDPAVAQQFSKLASAASALGHAEVEKLVSLIDRVDREADLYRYYGKGLSLFEEAAYTGSEKSAETVNLKTGSTIPLEYVKKAGLEPFKVLPTQQAAATTAGQFNLTKAAQLLTQLDPMEASIYEKALGACLSDSEPYDRRAPEIPLGNYHSHNPLDR